MRSQQQRPCVTRVALRNGRQGLVFFSQAPLARGGLLSSLDLLGREALDSSVSKPKVGRVPMAAKEVLSVVETSVKPLPSLMSIRSMRAARQMGICVQNVSR